MISLRSITGKAGQATTLRRKRVAAGRGKAASMPAAANNAAHAPQQRPHATKQDGRAIARRAARGKARRGSLRSPRRPPLAALRGLASRIAGAPKVCRSCWWPVRPVWGCSVSSPLDVPASFLAPSPASSGLPPRAAARRAAAAAMPLVCAGEAVSLSQRGLVWSTRVGLFCVVSSRPVVLRRAWARGGSVVASPLAGGRWAFWGGRFARARIFRFSVVLRRGSEARLLWVIWEGRGRVPARSVVAAWLSARCSLVV